MDFHKWILGLLVFGSFSAARASIIFEPSVGYSVSQMTSANLANVEEKSELKAPLAGLRLGYISNSRWWLGLDGVYQFSGKRKMTEPASTAEMDATAATGFVSLGYETRSRFRFWAGYGVYDTLNIKDGVMSGVDATFSGGTSWKAGLGFHLVNHLAFNIEYISHEYKRFKAQNGTENDLESGGFKSLKSGTALATLSFPFFW